MTIGLIGRKVGMTRVFTEDGVAVPVTVIHVEANRITQIKKPEVDGYGAVQVTCGTRRPSRVTKPIAGHYAKAAVVAGRALWELPFNGDDSNGLQVGGELKVDVFDVGQKVDVTGTSKGKGFAGAVKRHNFSTQDATHGNSLAHRAPGSIGQRQTPGRVPKGKRMAGHLGAKHCVSQNLEIVRIDHERNLLLIKGAVPGATGGDVIVRLSVKSAAARKRTEPQA
ncbi:MAG: 50S ribosomal protein L3 [Pseudomonadota bacterium]|nr:50S ribosomal protein L3 [Pseudomonadota bacterium]